MALGHMFYMHAFPAVSSCCSSTAVMMMLCYWPSQSLRRSISPLCRNISLFNACREWQAQLQVVLDSQCVGMLRLETGALKATYTNTLSSAQATIAMLMAVAGRRAAEAAIDKLQTVSRYGCSRPPGDDTTVRLPCRCRRERPTGIVSGLTCVEQHCCSTQC